MRKRLFLCPPRSCNPDETIGNYPEEALYPDKPSLTAWVNIWVSLVQAQRSRLTLTLPPDALPPVGPHLSAVRLSRSFLMPLPRLRMKIPGGRLHQSAPGMVPVVPLQHAAAGVGTMIDSPSHNPGKHPTLQSSTRVPSSKPSPVISSPALQLASFQSRPPGAERRPGHHSASSVHAHLSLQHYLPQLVTPLLQLTSLSSSHCDHCRASPCPCIQASASRALLAVNQACVFAGSAKSITEPANMVYHPMLDLLQQCLVPRLTQGDARSKQATVSSGLSLLSGHPSSHVLCIGIDWYYHRQLSVCLKCLEILVYSWGSDNLCLPPLPCSGTATHTDKQTPRMVSGQPKMLSGTPPSGWSDLPAASKMLSLVPPVASGKLVSMCPLALHKLPDGIKLPDLPVPKESRQMVDYALKCLLVDNSTLSQGLAQPPGVMAHKLDAFGGAGGLPGLLDRVLGLALPQSTGPTTTDTTSLAYRVQVSPNSMHCCLVSPVLQVFTAISHSQAFSQPLSRALLLNPNLHCVLQSSAEHVCCTWKPDSSATHQAFCCNGGCPLEPVISEEGLVYTATARLWPTHGITFAPAKLSQMCVLLNHF
eukprot:gene8753-26_t